MAESDIQLERTLSEEPERSWPPFEGPLSPSLRGYESFSENELFRRAVERQRNEAAGNALQVYLDQFGDAGFQALLKKVRVRHEAEPRYKIVQVRPAPLPAVPDYLKPEPK